MVARPKCTPQAGELIGSRRSRGNRHANAAFPYLQHSRWLIITTVSDLQAVDIPDGVDNMKRKSAGFSLIEVMMALVVVAICLGMGLPAFSAAATRVGRDNTYHLLTASLMSARSAAISRRKFVTVCPSIDGLTCRDDRIWQDGWIVFLDPDKTGYPVDASAILRRVDSIHPILARSSRDRVRYRPNGQATGTNLSVWLCTPELESLGRVAISNTGRARSQHAGQHGPPCTFMP